MLLRSMLCEIEKCTNTSLKSEDDGQLEDVMKELDELVGQIKAKAIGKRTSKPL